MVTPPAVGAFLGLLSQDGAWPSGKAPVFGTGIRRFESFRPSHLSKRFALSLLVAKAL